MNGSTDKYLADNMADYSTLEVVSPGQIPHQYSENAYASPLPEVNHQADAHLNYPEVVGGNYLPKADVPRPVDHTPPEAVNVADPEKVAAGAASTKEPRTCGLKRKVFWCLIVAAIVIVIAIVAGVVAGVMTSKNNAASASSSGDNTSTSTADTEKLVYANTNLATGNFTDGMGYENYLVVYQLNNRGIYMSAWNSSNKQWVVSAIVDGSTNNLGFDSVRKGTALSFDVFRYTDSSRDLHVYWQLPDSGGLSTIKALTYNSTRGVKTDSSLPTANWVDSAAGNNYISTAGSSLISYGKQCDLCNQYTYLYWQTSGGIREANFQNASTGWYSTNSVIQVDLSPPAENSSLALAHAAADTVDGHRSMDIFYRSTTSGLSQIVNGDGRYVGHSLGRDVGPETAIAAFSTGFNETSSGWSDPLGFQVLTMDPDAADDGVQLTYFKDDAWTTVSAPVQSLAGCLARNKMAANRARRIYCVEDNGDAVEIVEYEWQGDPDDTTTYSNYNRVGVVDTTVA